MKPQKSLRWPRVLLVALLTALGIFVMLLIKKPKLPQKTEPIQARVELAAGGVFVAGPDTALSGSDGARVESGTPIMAGSTISAGPGARALLRLPDGSSAFLRAGTRVKLADRGLELVGGEVWVDAPPADREPLVHRAGDVAVSADDAGLDLAKVDGGAEIYVARGMAIVTAKGGRVEVHAGERATVKGDAAPALSPVAFWDDWTGGLADAAGQAGLGAGSGTIYGVDIGAPPGAPAQKLQINSETVSAVLRDGLAETSVDQTFFNGGPRPVEGWYWFNLPEDASVAGFSVETNGVLVDGEIVEQHEAAQKYVAARSDGFSPAILEWVDGRSYRARIYPVPASGTRRVVLRYLQLSPAAAGKVSYLYPLGQAPVRIGELSLTVDLGDEGRDMRIATVADARVEDGGRRVTMRRSGYTPRADFQLEAEKKTPPRNERVLLSRFTSHDGSADYVMARYTPEVDWAKVKPMPAKIVLVVDTSAATDEASQQLEKTAAEAILRSLSASGADGDAFALMALDVAPRVLYPAPSSGSSPDGSSHAGLAPANDAEIGKALEKLAGVAPGGATDLSAMFEPALELLHGAEQPAVVYLGDGVATSGQTSPEQLAEHLRRALQSSRARLFAVGVGAHADHALLSQLARIGGGQEQRIGSAAEATPVALDLAAAIKAPTITDFSLDLGAGLDEPFVSASGKLSRGAEVVALARTHHDLPDAVAVRGLLGGEKIDRTVKVVREDGVVGAFVPRLWAAEYVRRLLGSADGPESERGRIVQLGIDYGIVTPFTSILALDSEAAYGRMHIPRRHSPLRGVKLGALDREQEARLACSLRPAPAQAGFGCAMRDKAPSEGAAPAAEGRDTEGGTGTRAKGEEGAMGNPNSAPRGQKYGGQDPGDDASPPAAGANSQTSAGSSIDVAKDMAERAKGAAAAPFANNAKAKEPPGAPKPAPAAAPHLAKPGPGKLAGPQQKGRDADKSSPAIDALPPRRPAPAPLIAMATCSDVSARPLDQRVGFWQKRLRNASGAADLIAAYQGAMRACELSDWQAERAFLRLLQLRIDSEADATTVLASLSGRPEVEKFVAKLILRRATDERIVAAVERALFGAAVDWNKVELELAAIDDLDKRIVKLRQELAQADGDPRGELLLMRLLARAGRTDEALAVGRKLRDQGLSTVATSRLLGDVLARAKLDDEAIRTYSDIVEFDPDSLASRQLLGDTYLARGWYEPAFRQYKTATEMAPAEPLAWLRLAAAAAGTGRVDEALRIERQVATAPGRPGLDDPRRFARLWSAARLARLIDKPPAGQAPGAIERKLKELQLFSGPGTLVIATWEDLSSDAVLTVESGQTPLQLGDLTDAAQIGLSARSMAPDEIARGSLVLRLRSSPRDESLAITRHDIAWDGRSFSVKVSRAELASGETRAQL